MKPMYGESRTRSFLNYLSFRLYSLMVRIPLLSEMCNMVAGKVIQFLRMWQYVSFAKIPGDYLEFGVYKGASFELSLRAASKFMDKRCPESPRFFAFDSFMGLSEPDPQKDGTVFAKGDYTASEERFLRNIKSAARGWEVIRVKGFYDQSLTPEVIQKHSLKVAAFVTIDCDLYQPSLQALRFVTPLLQTGCILFFDDWFYSHGNMYLGEAGACATWLKENPSLSLIDYGNVGVMGKCFIVSKQGEKRMMDDSLIPAKPS